MMFDISEKLIAEQSDEIYGVNTINWSDSSWKQLSLVNDEEVLSDYVFSNSVLSWKRESEPSIKYCLGRTVELVQRYSPQYRTLDTIDGEPMKFEIYIFELSSCRCSMTSYGDLQTMNGNALLTPHL